MWYSTKIKPESRIAMRDGKAVIIVCKQAFAAHVLYFKESGKVTSHQANVVDVLLSDFEWWCTAPNSHLTLTDSFE